MTDDRLFQITLGRLLDANTFRAAAEHGIKYRAHRLNVEACRAAEALGHFVSNHPEMLLMFVANSLTPEQALKRLAGVAREARRAFHRAELDAREAKRAFEERHRPAVLAAITQRMRLETELQQVQACIANADEERNKARERLEAAGLSAEQIASLELSPTQHQRAHQLGPQIEVLWRFQADPRREVLGGLELDGFPAGTLPSEQDAAELADLQRACL